MTKARIITNPSSGQNQGERAAELLHNRLQYQYNFIDQVVTQGDGDGQAAAEDACQENYDAIFAIGGDGTINEVLNGIAGQSHRPAVGLVPAGTNNTYIQLLGYPADFETAIEQIDFENIKSIDMGLCNDNYFNYYVSFGNLIDATTSTTAEEKSKLGSLAYIKNMVQALPYEDTIHIELHSDNESYVGEAAYVFVMLSNILNGNAVSNAEVTLDDGQFYVVVVKDESFLTKIEGLANIIGQKLEEAEGITSFTCQSLTIDSDRPDEVNLDLDGDIAGNLPAAIQILPRHIQLFMPHSE